MPLVKTEKSTLDLGLVLFTIPTPHPAQAGAHSGSVITSVRHLLHGSNAQRECSRLGRNGL